MSCATISGGPLESYLLKNMLERLDWSELNPQYSGLRKEIRSLDLRGNFGNELLPSHGAIWENVISC